MANYHSSGGNPGGLNMTQDNEQVGWTEVLSGNLNSNLWSANQSIPFAFNFFGAGVSSFKVSANGLITFETASALLPGQNEVLPSTNLPDHTIACFWDDFTSAPPTGGNDAVYTRLFGTVGSRQLWIKWFSFEYGNPSDNSFNYFACVLEEGSDKVYVVDMGNSGNFNFMSTTVGLQQDSSTAVQYGPPSITFTHPSSSSPANNTYYEFTPFPQQNLDLRILELFGPQGDGCYGANTEVRLSITNIGVDTATGMTARFATDGQTFGSSEPIPGSLFPGDTTSFSFAGFADLSAIGNYHIVAAVDLPGDGDLSNDTVSATLASLAAIAAPLIENFDAGLPANWLNDPNDDGEDWRNSNLGGADFGPGPNDHTAGAGGHYMWVDDSSPHGTETNLMTPCVDLAGLNFPNLEFWLWSFNNNSGNIETVLHVDLEVDGSWILDFLPPFGSQNTASWMKVESNLSDYAGHTIRLRFRMEENGGGFSHDIAIDDISITEGLGTDAELVRIVHPSTINCGLTANETISILVRNAGGTPITGFSAAYGIDGNPPNTTVVFPGTIQPGDSVVYHFGETVNLSALTTYELDVYIHQSGDADLSNDTINTFISNKPKFDVPYSENFDGGFPADWLNDLNDDGEEWLSSTAGIAGFGPGLVDHTSGSGEYVWVDDSGPHSAKTSLLTPCIDLVNQTQPEMEFWVWSNNEEPFEDDTKLHIDIKSNGVWFNDVISPIVDMDSLWEQIMVDLTAFAGTIINVRFRMEEFDTGFKHDIAIDDFRVSERLAFDAQLLSIEQPFGSDCALSDMETISIMLRNSGGMPTSGITASFSVDGGAPIPAETIPGTLQSGDTVMYTFATTADFSSVGPHSLHVSLQQSGDGKLSNNEIGINVTHIPGYPAPYSENFDAGFPSDWLNDSRDAGKEWIHSSTITTDYGPDDVDHTSGNGAYVYVDDSGPHRSETNLVSPCIDLTRLLAPELSFWVWSNNEEPTSVDTRLHIDISANGLWTQDIIPPITDMDSAWENVLIDLTPFSGTFLKVRFRIEEINTGFRHDISIDDFRIFEQLDFDIKLTQILDPPSFSCGLTASEAVSIQIENPGLNPMHGITAGFRMGTSGPFQTENIADTLLPGEMMTYTFSSTADLSAIGQYDISVFATATGDENHLNDSLATLVEYGASFSPPFVEDFNSLPAGISQFTQLSNATNSQILWQTNAGPTSTATTGPLDDQSGGGTYLYLESSGSRSGDQGILCLDCVDLTSGSPNNLVFNYHMFGSSIGFLKVDITNGDSTTTEVLLTGQKQLSNADTWTRHTIDLTPYAGSVVQICFTGEIQADPTGATFNGDIALDNIQIRETDPLDASLVKVDVLAERCFYTDSVPVAIDIVNEGLDTISNVLVSYSVNGGAFTSGEVVSSPIPVGDTLNYTFAVTTDLSAQGTYDIVAVSSTLGDTNVQNDTTTIFIDNSIIAPSTEFTHSTNQLTVSFANTTTGGGTFSYSWDFGDGSVGSSDPDPIYLYPNPGTYPVLLVVTNECGSANFRDSVTVGINGIRDAFESKISLFPNPTNGNLELSIEDLHLHEVDIQIFSIRGKSVYALKESLLAAPVSIPIQLSPALSEGIYLLRLRSEEGVIHRRFVLKR
ncbi:MAG: PKD domain-containing protein [Bacteroidota bacterium]